jgi:hypothetical protein
MSFPWEFGYFVDEHLRDTGFAVVRGRLHQAEHFELLELSLRDPHIVGMTCQGVFPMIGELPGNLPSTLPTEGRHEPYLRHIAGWAHCFRRPADYLPPTAPQVHFCNSDSLDPERLWQVAARSGPPSKRWDFIYSCLAEPANVVRKNWSLARRCALRFADELGLRGLLVGVADLPDVPRHPLIEVTPELRWSDFLRCIAHSRVAFFPNSWDPSPRLLAEALCLDVPVLVNRHILGGWHYVCDTTGIFFSDEQSAVDGMMSLRSERFDPRNWYVANYGVRNAGPRLANFLRTLASAAGRPCAWKTASFYSPRDWNGEPPRPADWTKAH